MKIPVLFTQDGSNYACDNRFDCYDISRNAFSYNDRRPLIAHPPCRLFSRLRAFSTASLQEKKCAYFALHQVRMFGGILEHPRSSTLWTSGNFNLSGDIDVYGGFLRSVNLSWFDYPAEKKTMLYFCGLSPSELPAIPLSLSPPSHVIAASGTSSFLPSVPKSARSLTPLLMLNYFAEVYQVIA